MTPKAYLRAIALGFAATGAVVALAPFAAAAQVVDSPYVNNGVTNAPDLFESDGFRPVWVQELQARARRAAAAKAKAKREAQRQHLAQKAKSKEKAKDDAKGKEQQGKPGAENNATVRTESLSFDQWRVTCREVSGQPKACSALLRVVQPNQQVVLLWEIGKGKDGAVHSVMQTPTGVLVQRGVDLQVGEETVGKLDYVSCVPQNCEASGKLDDGLADKLAKAGEVTVTVHAKDGRDIHFKFPVKGIDKAVAAVRS
jgi:invasion protein IalB